MAFCTNNGSASSGLAIEIRSDASSAKIFSAVDGAFIRFVVQRGILTSPFSFLVTQENAPLGTN